MRATKGECMVPNSLLFPVIKEILIDLVHALVHLYIILWKNLDLNTYLVPSYSIWGFHLTWLLF